MSPQRRDSEKQRGKRPRTSTDRPHPQSSSSATPWPSRPQKFDLPTAWRTLTAKQIIHLPEFKRHRTNKEWDHLDSFYYNGMLDVTMEPTRLLCNTTLRTLGFQAPMEQLRNSLGLGSMGKQYYPLFPDLARQFIASCQVVYESSDAPTAQDGHLRFKVHGVLYSLSFVEICECFGFDASQREVKLPDTFPESQIIWGEIAKDTYRASTAAHRDIRHPVLRMFVKVLGYTLLCAMENNKMRLKHLILLSYAIGDRWDAGLGFAEANRINLGALFAHHLEEQKEKALSPRGKTESIGSLLTPLMQKAGVPLPTSEDSIIRKVCPFDEDHLKRGHHIKPAGYASSTALKPLWCHEFIDNEGQPRHIRLPTRYASVDSLEDLRFIIPESEHFTLPPRQARTTPRTSTSRSRPAAAAPATDDEDVEEDLPPFEPLGPYPYASDEVIEDTVAFRRHQESIFARLWNYMRCTRVRDDVAPSHRHRARTPTPETSSGSQEF